MFLREKIQWLWMCQCSKESGDRPPRLKALQTCFAVNDAVIEFDISAVS